MRFIQSFILVIFTTSTTFAQEDNTVFYKTKEKHSHHYVELTNEIAKVYQMGRYFDPAGSGYAILKTDTLIKITEKNYDGKYYSLNNDNNSLTLETKKGKRYNLEKEMDSISVFLKLNNAYYLKRYFDLSDRINKEFPLNHYTFRNGYSAWNKLSNKDYNHENFKKNTDREIQTVYDSIFNIQTKLDKTTDFIIENSKQLSYAILKDSLRTLPVDYRSQSAYFDKSVYQMAKSNPEYFYKLLQDFPASKKNIYFAVEQDKELIKHLKQVQGYDGLKKDFFKDYKFGKTMPYKTIGIYAIFAGLITWLIIAQP